MVSRISLMLFLALFMMVFMKNLDGRRVEMEDENDFLLSDPNARAFLDLAESYAKRADGNCITCSKLTQSKCCAPDLCIKKFFHNECMKVKPGK